MTEMPKNVKFVTSELFKTVLVTSDSSEIHNQFKESVCLLEEDVRQVYEYAKGGFKNIVNYNERTEKTLTKSVAQIPSQVVKMLQLDMLKKDTDANTSEIKKLLKANALMSERHSKEVENLKKRDEEQKNMIEDLRSEVTDLKKTLEEILKKLSQGN